VRRTHRSVRRLFHLALAICEALVFVIVASSIDGDRASDLEETTFRALNGLPGFLAYPVWPFMQVGNLLVIPLGALAAAILRRFRLAAALLIAGGAKLQMWKAIKDRHRRRRRRPAPSVSPRAILAHRAVGGGIARPRRPRLVGAHLPLDVIAGGAVGLALGGLLNFAFGSLAKEVIRPPSPASVSQPASTVLPGLPRHRGSSSGRSTMGVMDAERLELYELLKPKLDEEPARALVLALAPNADQLATKADLDVRFAQVDVRFAQVDARFAQVDARFAELQGQMDSRFGQMDGRFGQIDARFGQMEATLTRRMVTILGAWTVLFGSAVGWAAALLR
jgi:hypothetical protein